MLAQRNTRLICPPHPEELTPDQARTLAEELLYLADQIDHPIAAEVVAVNVRAELLDLQERLIDLLDRTG